MEAVGRIVAVLVVLGIGVLGGPGSALAIGAVGVEEDPPPALTETGEDGGPVAPRTGPRGTGTASVELLSVDTAGSRLQLGRFDAQSTLDHNRLALLRDRAWNRVVPLATYGVPSSSAVVRRYVAAEEPLGKEEMLVESGHRAKEWVRTQRHLAYDDREEDVVLNEQKYATVGLGGRAFARVDLSPVRTAGTLDAVGAESSQGSSLGNLDVMDGFIRASNAGPAALVTDAGDEFASASVDSLTVETVGMLNIPDVLAAIGVPMENVGLTRLGAVADAFEVAPPAGAASWEAYTVRLLRLRDDLDGVLAAGTACALLDATPNGSGPNISRETQYFGIAPLDCLKGDPVRLVLTAVLRVVNDTYFFLKGQLQTRPLITLKGVTADVHAAAGVSKDGEPRGSASATGGIGAVEIASTEVTDGILMDAPLVEINRQEEWINEAIDSSMRNLGHEYVGTVRVRLLPRYFSKPEVVDGYAIARAEMTMFEARVLRPEAVADMGISAGQNVVPLPHLEPVAATAACPVRGDTEGTPPGPHTMVVTVGDLRACAEHTRPGVEMHCEVKCDATPPNLDWDRRTGFGGGSDSSANLPRTGPSNAVAVALGSGCLAASAWLRRRIRVATVAGATLNPPTV